MQLVRDVAAQLIEKGKLRALQRGREVSLTRAKGPIRLALAQKSDGVVATSADVSESRPHKPR
jgi:hypothetical protein